MTTTDMENVTAADVGWILSEIAAQAAANPDTPAPLMEGTFAMYPMKDGGVMMVAAVPGGPMEGVHYYPVSPFLIRSMVALLGKGSAIKTGVGKAFNAITGRRRKAIGDASQS